MQLFNTLFMECKKLDAHPTLGRSKTHFKNTCAGISRSLVKDGGITAKRQAIEDMKDDPRVNNAWLTNSELEIRQMHRDLNLEVFPMCLIVFPKHFNNGRKANF